MATWASLRPVFAGALAGLLACSATEPSPIPPSDASVTDGSDARVSVGDGSADAPAELATPVVDAGGADLPPGPVDATIDGDAPGTVGVKFCNPLSLQNNQSLTLVLEIGSAPVVTLSAPSGTCAPEPGAACVAVPAGSRIPLVMKFGDTRITSVVHDLRPDSEWLFLADLDQNTQVPVIEGGELDNTKARCHQLSFSDVFPSAPRPDGGGQ